MDDVLLRRLSRLGLRAGRLEGKTAGFLPFDGTNPPAGSWTPTLIGLTTGGTLTYDATNTKCEYTRIDNRVFINGRIRFTVITVNPVGNVVITGLPFAAASTGFGNPGGVTMSYWTLDVPAGYTFVQGAISDGESQIRLVRSGDNVAPASVAGGEVVLVGGVADFKFEGQYRTI